MKVGDLQIGAIYRLSTDRRVSYRMGPTPLEEASRLALHILKKKDSAFTRPARTMTEPLIYLGPKMVYGGMNGDKAAVEKAHRFVRPNGKRLYIYGEHIKHIMPFTQG